MQLLGDSPAQCAYIERMYARPRAPRRIGEIFRAMQSGAAVRLLALHLNDQEPVPVGIGTIEHQRLPYR
jgi:hypothetical protein